MTEETSAPDPTGFLRDFDERQRAYKALSEAIHAANKDALFPVLAGAGITSILVRFDGSGDSGQIEEIDVVSGDKPVSLPAGHVTVQRANWGASEPESIECSVSDAVETLVYAFLEETHGGWENNAGAYGEFTFTVAERSIILDYNERYEDTHYTQHSF
ncbi:MAG TPA: hypothetical protein VGL72_16195 [Bryobacteraceae bacterium]|jgi:hypothetical protein